MNKDEYYLKIAEAVASKSTCLKKHYGAVIVKNNEIIATGYNGPARGEEHCKNCTKVCNSKDYEAYSSCPAIHAEQNAMLSASRNDMLGATMYLYGEDVDGQMEERGMEINAVPCEICFRLLKNSGIDKVISRDGMCAKRDENGILRRI